ncbi:MAG: MauE/DoxX family redox-associated membrane protein [Desulfobacterales bacterium]|jgi:uncharacterized membrane protein YphA (DoxX/SURF4 family)
MGQKSFFSLYEKSVYLILRVGLGVVFIWASWSKIQDPASFARIIENYQILPPLLVNPVALLLPWVEALCGIFLLCGFFVKGSVFIVNALLVVFGSVLSFNIYRGIDVTCGCFSVSSAGEKMTWLKVIRDLPLLAAGLWILYYRLKLDRRALKTQPAGLNAKL